MHDAEYFDCPFCGHSLPLDPDRVGDWLSCPECDHEIAIPDPRRIGIRQDEDAEPFSPLELVVLEDETPTVQRKIDQRAKRGRWRPAAVAVFLAERLLPLRHAISVTAGDEPVPAVDKATGAAELDRQVAAFCLAIHAIHDWVCDRLPDELDHADLVELVDSMNYIAGQVQVLADFSQAVRHLHCDHPECLELLRVTRGWAGFCLQAFAMLMAQLHLAAQEADEQAPGGVLSVSFVPPDLPRYLYLRRHLSLHC